MDLVPRKLPTLQADTLNALMAQRIEATRTPETPIPMLWQGLWSMEIPVQGDSRYATAYIPQNCPQGSMFVLLNVPAGEQAVPFLQKSGWIEQADRFHLCLLAAEPGAGGWKSPDQERAYLEGCLSALRLGLYFRGGLSLYLVGYGPVGAELHRLAAVHPLQIAAAVFVQASDLAPDIWPALEATSLNTEERHYGDFCLKDVPVPVWIVSSPITEGTKAAIQHWKRCNQVGAPCDDPTFGQVYTQASPSFCTPVPAASQVAVLQGAPSPCSAAATAAICAFLRRFVRFGNQGPLGNTLSRSVDYEALDVHFHHFTDAHGVQREYLVYYPKSCRSKGKLPLVFAIHGACESIRNYFEESQWYLLAEEKGFLLAMPETTLTPVPSELAGSYCKAWRAVWNIGNPDRREADVDYLNEVLDRVESEYPVDPARIYCTGHSMGCMTTHYLGSGSTGRHFAALGVTSGPLYIYDADGTERLPVFMTIGEYDLWGHRVEEDSSVTAAIDFWLVRDGLAAPQTAHQMRTEGFSAQYRNGRWQNYVWTSPEGIPLLRYTCLLGKDHMNTPAENRALWDEWFAKWSLNEDHRRCFEGQPVL